MDINKLAKELKNIKPFPNMQPEIFMVLKDLLPMVAILLFVTNKKGEFALVQKKKSEINGWALPGGYLGLNENFETASQRIAEKYLGIKVLDCRFLDMCNLTENIHGNGNGHAVALVFKCTAKSESKIAHYFSSVPENTLKHHIIMINKVVT